MPGNESTAKFLGYAGLIPFVIFSIGSWTSLPYVNDATSILVSYAAIILSFMGAIHWGVAMASVGRPCARYFIASIIPALIAWIALLLPQPMALSVLLAGFIGLLAYDRSVEKAQSLPGWYLPMRSRLTFVVALCLAGALFIIGKS